MTLIHHIPIATTVFCIFFFIELIQHYRKNMHSMHLLWWTIGIFFYGAGTVTESIHTIFGYSPLNYKVWYISGAFLGGVPLAQGTVYLLLKRRTANILTAVIMSVILIASVLVILSPLAPVSDKFTELNGKLFEWKAVRRFTPFINLYAFVFLVGGAIYSAILYSRHSIDKTRCRGNISIAIGGLLPAIGGILGKQGHIELLYLSAFFGIAFIHAGYETIKWSTGPSVYATQAKG